MLAAYAQVGLAEKVLELYQLMMEEEGAVNPDARTFVSTLQAYGMLAEKDPHTVVMDGLPVKTESLNRGRAVHVHSWKNGFDSDALVAAKLVTLYGKCGAIVDAELYEQMLLEESVSPDDRPFAQSLLHTTLARSLEQGGVIHAEARRNGYDSDACVGSTLVSLYGMSWSTADAQIVFDGLSNRNVVSWTALLAAYVHPSRAFQRRL